MPPFSKVTCDLPFPFRLLSPLTSCNCISTCRCYQLTWTYRRLSSTVLRPIKSIQRQASPHFCLDLLGGLAWLQLYLLLISKPRPSCFVKEPCLLRILNHSYRLHGRSALTASRGPEQGLQKICSLKGILKKNSSELLGRRILFVLQQIRWEKSLGHIVWQTQRQIHPTETKKQCRF